MKGTAVVSKLGFKWFVSTCTHRPHAEVSMNSNKAIKQAVAAQLPTKPVVVVPPKLKPGELAPGVDQPKTGPQTKPSVKAWAGGVGGGGGGGGGGGLGLRRNRTVERRPVKSSRGAVNEVTF